MSDWFCEEIEEGDGCVLGEGEEVLALRGVDTSAAAARAYAEGTHSGDVSYPRYIRVRPCVYGVPGDEDEATVWMVDAHVSVSFSASDATRIAQRWAR